MNFVSCAKWIKRGVAKSVPDKVHLSSQELQTIWNARKEEIEGAKEEIEEMAETSENKDDIYNFEGYDNDSENVRSILGIETLLTLDSSQEMETLLEDVDSEEEDEIINPDDNLIVVGHVEEDASVLEVYVHNEEKGDMYVHHDILLPSVPLCLEWLSFDPTQPSPGNLVAVGAMCPEIMVWDLDLVNCLEPAFKLGRYSKKASRKPEKQNFGHQDAVLDIAWNESVQHLLASASVDQSVIIWDVELGKVGMHLRDFTDKVQSIKWHPSDPQTLLSGCCDKYVRKFDCRLDCPNVVQWEVDGEVEIVCWNPATAQSWDALVGTNNGRIHCIDTRTNTFKWQITAHEKEVTGLSIHHLTPEIMVTCSTDGYLKLWDLSKDAPNILSTKAVNSGDLHCLDINPDIPYLVCTGGTNKSHAFCVNNIRKQIPDQQRFYNEGTSSSQIDSAAVVGFKPISSSRNRLITKKKKLMFKKKHSVFNSR